MLKILGKRQDGYHNLVTLYQLLSWGDKVSIATSTDTTHINVTGPQAAQVPQGEKQEDNLVWRAWRLMAKELSCLDKKITIGLHKNIPAGSGLGGGSSNAATLMRMLRLLWRPAMPLEDLASMGASLGADIPLFIRGWTALASGKGDQLQSQILPQYYYLIFCPAIHSSTALLFSSLAKDREQHEGRDDYDGLDYNKAESSLMQSLQQENTTWLSMADPNDFLNYALLEYPELKQIHAAIGDSTPNKLGNRIFLSGSGSSMFAVYANKQQAYSDQQELLKKHHTDCLKIILTKGINCAIMDYNIYSNGV